ncbi:MAG: AsmA family protein [Candidatus Omnitrophota bacterium]
MGIKKIVSIILIVLVAFFVIGIVKDQVIKGAITTIGSNILGAKIKIDGFSLGIFTQSVRIKGFKIYNPEGFPKEVLVDIPTIYVDYDLGAILKKKIHLRKIVFDLKEVTIIKNKDGVLNVDSLKVAKKEETSKKEAKKDSQDMPLEIDVAILSIGKAVFKDFSGGDKPKVEVFDVGIKEKKYKNIKSAQQLATLIFVEAMKATTIKSALIYGAATIAGAAILPVGVAAVLTGKDSVEETFSLGYEKVYATTLAVLGEMGSITSEDKAIGEVKGKVSGSSVTIKFIEEDKNSTKVTISARQLMLPKPKIAGGVLFEITNRLK